MVVINLYIKVEYITWLFWVWTTSSHQLLLVQSFVGVVAFCVVTGARLGMWLSTAKSPPLIKYLNKRQKCLPNFYFPCFQIKYLWKDMFWTLGKRGPIVQQKIIGYVYLMGKNCFEFIPDYNSCMFPVSSINTSKPLFNFQYIFLFSFILNKTVHLIKCRSVIENVLQY